MAIPVAAPKGRRNSTPRTTRRRIAKVRLMRFLTGTTALGATRALLGGRPLARSHERPTRLTSMPLERLPDPPRVVVPHIEGRDTLYEFDVSAAPSREWRAASLRPPPG